MNKLLVDTNVLIYSTNYDSKFFDETNKFISEAKYDLCTTSKNLSEYLSVITRYPSTPLNISKALGLVDNFVSIMKILYPDENSFSRFKSLLKKYEPSGLKIHDFEIVSIALANNIDSIFTYNLKDFIGIDEVQLIKI